MKNYMQHVGLTAWRRKSTILLAAVLLAVLVFGLHYTQQSDEEDANKINPVQASNNDNGGPAEVVAALLQSASVKFVESSQKQKAESRENGGGGPQKAADQEDPVVHNEVGHESYYETNQQLGVPFVNLDLKNPYIPKKRIVHFDLKGAPPKISYLKKIFPLIRTIGATGILLEYEDMFPYDGILKNLSAKNSYTKAQIKEILTLAEDSKLEVIPLVQTFGHVEFALKHEEWIKIREIPNSPQAVCPSRNSTLDFIGELVSQVLAMHPNIKYFHMGCDEVFQMGECDLCRLEVHDNLFLRHVRNVANIVREKYPKLRLLIWDDMLRHLTVQNMNEFALGSLVEPMVWVYAEDIYRFVQPQIWEKYGLVFKTAWTASAFKGAFGETLYVPEARRHLENNLRWLDVMSQQSRLFKNGLSGIVLTGWQRYDHFAVLCELLPVAVPSLALNLVTVAHGYFNASLRSKFLSTLSCPQSHYSKGSSGFISLDSDPQLWDKLGRCMFPGSPVFRLTYRLHSMENEAEEYIKSIKYQKGWLTDYNIRHNYSLPLRVEELTGDLARIYHGMLTLARSAVDAMADVFDKYTIAEWIEQRVYPYIEVLERIQNQSSVLKDVNKWPARPLPPLKELERLGVALPP